MSSLLIENALAVVTMDDEDRILSNSSVLIEDGVITYVGGEAREADEVISAEALSTRTTISIRHLQEICPRSRRWSSSRGS